MRAAFVVILFIVAFSAQANVAGDTIYWQIQYGKVSILDGNLNSAQPSRYELTVKAGYVKDLTVSFAYNVQPNTSALIIKEKNETLRTIDHDPVMGSYFVVPVRELISTHQPNVNYELDFYYTTNQNPNERKLATIIFIFK